MNWRYVDHPIFSYHRHVYHIPGANRVYIVWRSEYVREKDTTVARVCEIIGSVTDLFQTIPHFIKDLID